MLKSIYSKSFTLLLFFLIAFVSDSSANQWIQRSSFGSWGRHRAVAVAIETKVYAGTGHLNGDGSDEWYPDWWQFDPATNSWGQKADYLGNNGNGDQDLTAIAINGFAYVGLGQFGNEEHFKYNPFSNTWTQIADAPNGYFANTDPFVIGDKGYFPEGLTDLLYEYDPVTDVWTSMGNMPTIVGHRDPTFVIGSKGYFKHGTSFFEYDPITNIWTPKTSFPGTAPNNNLGLSQRGYGYYIGGYLSWGEMYPEVWQYDPTNDSWLQLPDYPFTARRWAVKAKVGERCYIGLGTNGTNFNDFWEFDAIAGNDEFTLESFKAFPTLADDHVNFASENMSDFDITVFNLSGEIITTISTQNGTARLERNMMTSGTYVYHVLLDNQVVHSDRFVFR